MLPQWLDPAAELEPVRDTRSRFEYVLHCFETVLRLGCTPGQAAGVTANSINESGWGQKIYCGNAFGWKINRSFAETYRRTRGRSAPWWRARGNIGSGDPPEVYYRVFGTQDAQGKWSFDFAAALGEWVSNFVPRPGTSTGRYRRCGEIFWAGGAWFPELIRAGYKGSVTAANPQPSIREHSSLVNTVMVVWVQRRLGGLVVDGSWGPASTAKAREYQRRKRLPETGTPSAELVDSLVSEWRLQNATPI